MRKYWLAGVIGLGCLSPAVAADIDIPGIVSNETRSFAGREFYEAFVDNWQAYDPNGTVSLVINEKPAARTGTLITISYDGLPIFQRFIAFNSRNARAAAADASQRIYNVVLSGELERQFEGTELSGDGL
ncbi:MAG: CsgE family curli-type amyloid fiber assembly protein [Panacagrimonas sp.]